MSRQPATREDIVVMAKIAGLSSLPPHYIDEIVEAYRNIEPMLWRIRTGRDRADEPAHAYDPRKFMPR